MEKKIDELIDSPEDNDEEINEINRLRYEVLKKKLPIISFHLTILLGEKY